MSTYKYAVVFAGQGAQKPGMGKSLYEASPAARAVFDLAGDEIKYDCFEATEERLKQTEVTQPAVYTVDMAAYAALREALGMVDAENDPDGASGVAEPCGVAKLCGVAEPFGVAGIGSESASGFAEPCGVAGFSLGEYAALTAAGVIRSLAEGLALVKIRSSLMKDAGTAADGTQRGAMAAGMGDRGSVLDLVEKARNEDVLEAVNYNSPLQTVVAGDMAAVERFIALAAEDRSLGVRAKGLSVSGAFHSPLMKPAAEGLTKALDEYDFAAPALPVYLNVTGGTYEDYDKIAVGSVNAKIKAILVCQIQSPLYWQQTVEAMAEAGIEAIVEVGPGRTLTGLAKKIAPELVALHVEDEESLAETVRLMKGGKRPD